MMEKYGASTSIQLDHFLPHWILVENFVVCHLFDFVFAVSIWS